MSDYNFFDPYIVPPKRFEFKNFWVIFLFVVLFAALFWSYLVMQQRVDKLNAENDEIKDYINSDSIHKKIEEANLMNNAIADYSEISTMLSIVNSVENQSSSFDSTHLEMLNRTMPDDVFIDTINAKRTELSLIGHAESIEGIALFNHRLSNQEVFDISEIKHIQGEVGKYSYEIVAKRKGGR